MRGTAAAGVEARIAELLEAHRPHLAALVHQAVDEELARLVDERIAARNRNGHVTPGAAPADSVPVKVCTGMCGRTLPISAFERGRSKCRQCRRAEQRDRELRARPADPEPPRTSPDG